MRASLTCGLMLPTGSFWFPGARGQGQHICRGCQAAQDKPCCPWCSHAHARGACSGRASASESGGTSVMTGGAGSSMSTRTGRPRKIEVKPRDFIDGAMVLAEIRIDGPRGLLMLCGECDAEFAMRVGDIGKVRAECAECRKARRKGSAEKLAARAERAAAARARAEAREEARQAARARAAAVRAARAALSLSGYDLAELTIERREG